MQRFIVGVPPQLWISGFQRVRFSFFRKSRDGMMRRRKLESQIKDVPVRIIVNVYASWPPWFTNDTTSWHQFWQHFEKHRWNSCWQDPLVGVFITAAVTKKASRQASKTRSWFINNNALELLSPCLNLGVLHEDVSFGESCKFVWRLTTTLQCRGETVGM